MNRLNRIHKLRFVKLASCSAIRPCIQLRRPEPTTIDLNVFFFFLNELDLYHQNKWQYSKQETICKEQTAQALYFKNEIYKLKMSINMDYRLQ